MGGHGDEPISHRCDLSCQSSRHCNRNNRGELSCRSSRHCNRNKSRRTVTDTGLHRAWQVLIAGADATAVKLQSVWQSMITGASLTATMAFAGLFCAPDQHEGMSTLSHICRQLYIALISISFVCSITSVSLATMMLTRMSMLPRTADVSWFIQKYHWAHTLPAKFYEVSNVSLLIGTVAVLWPMFDAHIALIGTALTGFVMALFFPLLWEIRQATSERLRSAIGNQCGMSKTHM